MVVVRVIHSVGYLLSEIRAEAADGRRMIFRKQIDQPIAHLFYVKFLWWHKADEN